MENNEKNLTALTGRRYNSVEELLKGEGTAEETQEQFNELAKETKLVEQLIEMRKAANLTQQQIAEKIGKTQSAISKLESGRDEELTVSEIHDYSNATGQRFMLMFGKPLIHAEAVKWHAFGIREHLSKLAKIAHTDGQIETAINSFFNEALLNINVLIGRCYEELPGRNKSPEVRLKRLDVHLTSPALSPCDKEKAVNI
jgi:transcriptional regulator with XRE-family HTH domain